MKIKDLLNHEIDVDILNDYLDADIPAFVGPQGLTEAGKQHYKEVLDLEIELDSSSNPRWAEIKLNNYPEEEADRLFDAAYNFFADAAGYCSVKEYEKYFKEE